MISIFRGKLIALCIISWAGVMAEGFYVSHVNRADDSGLGDLGFTTEGGVRRGLSSFLEDAQEEDGVPRFDSAQPSVSSKTFGLFDAAAATTASPASTQHPAQPKQQANNTAVTQTATPQPSVPQPTTPNPTTPNPTTPQPTAPKAVVPKVTTPKVPVVRNKTVAVVKKVSPSGGAGSSGSSGRAPVSPLGSLYAPCPKHPLQGQTGVPLEKWLIEGLKAATVLDQPFKRAVYWCNVFPPDVYAALAKYWMPHSLMHRDAKSGKSKLVSHRYAGARFKTSLAEFNKISPAEGRRKWNQYDQGREIWKKVGTALFSKAFEKAIWDKMGLTAKWLFRDSRIQTDHPGGAGYSIGVHPDISKKIVTMMFYFPSGSKETQKKQAAEFGTCLHTVEQYNKRSKFDGQSKCAAKFMFLPNSGFSFTVSRLSYHSVQPRKAGSGLRRTFMLNWYKAQWIN